MIDLCGKKYGRLTAIARKGINVSGNAIWLCECDCGSNVFVSSNNLRSGHTKSCGCLRKELMTKHGHNRRNKQTSTYRSWASMIQRCTNPNSARYSRYGARNITICKQWMEFANFLKDMGESPTDRHQIDRVDNDGNYCKENCRWATRTEQQRNTRRSHVISYGGKTQCLAAWAEELCIVYATLWGRICVYGWSIEKAFTTPTRKRTK